MKMRNHWLDNWENEEDNKNEIRIYENELESAIKEYRALEQVLKSVYYRIEKLKGLIEKAQP